MNHTQSYRPRIEVLEDRNAPGHLGAGAGHGPPDHAAAASHANANPGALPVHSHSFGQSYGEWSASWWQWTYSMPADQHPLFDTADCSEGQSGHVWFLGGTFTVVQEGDVVTGVAERDCTVPAGTALFFPIVNAEVSDLEGLGLTEDEMREVANFLADHITDLHVTIDGVSLDNLSSYRAESPLFAYGPLPENNILGEEFTGQTFDSVGDGVFLMLAPLPKGEHTIHFEGSAVFTLEDDGFDFTFHLDITYNITVAAPNE